MAPKNPTIIYYGKGKGKTTASLGLSIRSLGHGKKVVFIQFLKKQKTGEIESLKKLGAEVYQFGTEKFFDPENPDEETKKEIQKGWEFAKKKFSENPDVLVLDEINLAIDFKLVNISEVIDLIDKKPRDMILVLTGRNPPDELVQKADISSDVVKIRHDFDLGEKAREGVEY